jgi:hypothetical protein
MVYKTKKINRKRYIKRQSRRKMYGGEVSLPSVSKYNLPPTSKTNKTVDELLKVEPPSTLDNVKKSVDIGLQLGNNLTASGLEYLQDGVEDVAESIGIDPNASVEEEVGKIADKSEEIVKAFSSPEGQRALKNLGSAAAEFSKEVIGPASQEIVSSIVDNSGPIANKGVRAVLDGLGATPFGPLIEAPRFIADVAGIVQDSTAMAADVLDISKDAIDKGKENSEKVQSAWSDVQSVIEHGNKAVSDTLDSVQKSVDNYGKNIAKDSLASAQKKMSMPEIPNGIQRAGGSIKKYHREAIMIGGRVNKSQIEFLSPYVNRSQILQQYGGKCHTKRRNRVRRRMTLHRR